ncbi:MAG: hypothetical protein HY376_03000 [Candidatus Blackburnbacteria bacterium]|nr:hypothetical protein [Candidatus Blackburnbacteria bacterium]
MPIPAILLVPIIGALGIIFGKTITGVTYIVLLNMVLNAIKNNPIVFIGIIVAIAFLIKAIKS